MEKELENAVCAVGANCATLQDKRLVLREKTAELESVMKSMEQVETPTKHYFSKDVYAREMEAVAGTLIVGKIHKHSNLNIISKGEISVLSIDGLHRIKAPATFVSSPGVKRIGYVHEDVVWTTIHGTSETDLDKIEETFIAKEYSDVIEISDQELKLLKGE